MTDTFDLRAPLTPGVTVLEASAGTGKTYTIAGLATRHVAEGLPLDQLLVVTFTRLATGELRERVRDRLLTAERALRTGVIEDGDDLAAFLAEQDVELRCDRLARALASFDSATIATTHTFCLEALGSLGFTGNVERDCAFVEEVSDLMDDVVNDLFVRRFFAERPAFARDEAMAIAREAIKHPKARLVPDDAAADSTAAMRVRLAKAARAELERRKRIGSLMTFDDVLTRLADALEGDGGAQVAARLRERYRVVLVDEFQDTDPVQWQIMRRAFDHPDGTLVLIGDPKQAIYAFRGADVYAYLDAARGSVRGTLGVNWRSDQRLLDAYDLLFANAKLGHDEIAYRATRAAPEHAATRLHGAPVDAALRVRVLDRRTVKCTGQGRASAQPARAAIAVDVARDIAALLHAEATITRGTPGEPPRTVRPGDIAVLVRRNQDAALVQAQLGKVGVPAVIAGAGSVFGTAAARDWLTLLEALERPSSVGRVHAAALTPFVGWSATQVACASDAEWEDVHDRVHAWAQVLREDGVAALVQAMTVQAALARRVLGLEGGERLLTDLRHIGQLLHAEAMDDGLGAAALTQWLRRRILEAKKEGNIEERARRLESDAAAVQVLTIHRSKGLEFPIVYCPFLWEPSWIPDEELPVFFHDASGARTLDVGLSGAPYREHSDIAKAEERGEDLRLAYVALTRARHQAVIWWAGSWDSRNSPLSRLVFARAQDGSVPAEGPREVPSDDVALARFAALGGDGCISVEQAPGAGLLADWSPPAEDRHALAAASFDRGIDRTWRRTSYSDITAPAHEAFGSEPERDEVEDEQAAALTAALGSGDEALREVPSPLADLPGGVRVGTLVHDVFEAVDFTAADLVGAMGVAVRDAVAYRRVEIGDADVLASALAGMVQTPLPLLDGVALRDVAASDRLDELGFELPLAGAASPRAIGALLRSLLPSEDPLHAYADRLDDPLLRPVLRGFLTGSIDLTFRTGDGRFAIVDYKTNRLGDLGAPLTLWDYRPAALAEEMRRTHYALQALLYTVALHRYLRWRVAGYSPDRDIAGVFYLFVRGMAGPDAPAAGVFSWRPPGELVVALSDLLDQGMSS